MEQAASSALSPVPRRPGSVQQQGPHATITHAACVEPTVAARSVTRAWQLPDVSRATGWLRCFKNQPSNRIINKRLSKESWVRMLPDHTEATSSLARLTPARCCSQRPLCARKSHGGGGWWFLRSQPGPGQAPTPRQSSCKAISSTAGPGQRQTHCCVLLAAARS